MGHCKTERVRAPGYILTCLEQCHTVDVTPTYMHVMATLQSRMNGAEAALEHPAVAFSLVPNP